MRSNQIKPNQIRTASLMQWQCERPFVVCAPCPQWCPSQFCFSQHRFLAPNVAPEHARPTVVVPALLAQVLMPVSRQSPFPPWVLVHAPCFCFYLCFCFCSARGCWGSSARGKRPACRRRLSNHHGTVHVLRPSRDRVDISICEL
jgi:hypothetical protein